MEMEKDSREIGIGYRHKKLKTSFKLGLHALLTTCSKEVITFCNQSICIDLHFLAYTNHFFTLTPRQSCLHFCCFKIERFALRSN